mmetsp:Transcript_42311/g.99330  ORF Transcript_42311/g.99330 Transcript_42311/m.99330 type:complete len:214 (-) Transcript_42311:235-876(-)
MAPARTQACSGHLAAASRGGLSYTSGLSRTPRLRYGLRCGCRRWRRWRRRRRWRRERRRCRWLLTAFSDPFRRRPAAPRPQPRPLPQQPDLREAARRAPAAVTNTLFAAESFPPFFAAGFWREKRAPCIFRARVSRPPRKWRDKLPAGIPRLIACRGFPPFFKRPGQEGSCVLRAAAVHGALCGRALAAAGARCGEAAEPAWRRRASQAQEPG